MLHFVAWYAPLDRPIQDEPEIEFALCCWKHALEKALELRPDNLPDDYQLIGMCCVEGARDNDF